MNYLIVIISILVIILLFWIIKVIYLKGYLKGSSDRYEFFKKRYGKDFIDVLKKEN